ncbi:hypothetical protein PG997_015371 [Apiospora hydei]|uniref:Uncharacterized protein n=1 Tax=Apiospora hydei TaxID=1337664 RepID=A0ABR1UQF0_9PEZI
MEFHGTLQRLLVFFRIHILVVFVVIHETLLDEIVNLGPVPVHGLHEIAPLRDGVLGIVLEQAEQGVQLLEEHADAVGWLPGRVLCVPVQFPVLGPLGQIVEALEGALQLLSKLFIAVVDVFGLGLEIGLHQVGKLVEPICSLIVRLVLKKFLEDGELLEVSETVERCRVSLVDWVVCWNGFESSVGSGSVAVLRRRFYSKGRSRLHRHATLKHGCFQQFRSLHLFDRFRLFIFLCLVFILWLSGRLDLHGGSGALISRSCGGAGALELVIGSKSSLDGVNMTRNILVRTRKAVSKWRELNAPLVGENRFNGRGLALLWCIGDFAQHICVQACALIRALTDDAVLLSSSTLTTASPRAMDPAGAWASKFKKPRNVLGIIQHGCLLWRDGRAESVAFSCRYPIDVAGADANAPDMEASIVIAMLADDDGCPVDELGSGRPKGLRVIFVEGFGICVQTVSNGNLNTNEGDATNLEEES